MNDQHIALQHMDTDLSFNPTWWHDMHFSYSILMILSRELVYVISF